MEVERVKIEWLGHATFKIGDEKIIYTDPYQIGSGEPADIILITHSHFDHCSPEDIQKIIKKGTVLFVTPDCQSKVSNFEDIEIKLVEPDKTYEADGVRIETLPAYNLKPERLKFHPKENEWVGYVITVNGKKIYHAGDTDLIPEMKNLQNIGIALLPIGGTYTMDVEEAAEAANLIRPKTVVPMHYNKVEGTEADPEEFKQKVSNNINVKIL
ncbi:MAG: MBL fold metallo-hydrolase [Nanoarchaeota archaeon]|nr:MBL fold metallo-hydrolase [Nanoarchaeota archaeon]